LEIIAEGISVTKPDSTRVTYYGFPEYEIHYNLVPPNTVQQWHHHEVIEEALYLISGQLEVHWREDGERMSRLLTAGNVARFERSPHTLANRSPHPATFLVVRLILTGTSRADVFASDKHLDRAD